MRRWFKNEYLKRLEMQWEEILKELKKHYKKVSVQKLWIDRIVAGWEIGVYNNDVWQFILFYYPESKSWIDKFIQWERGWRYSEYALAEIKNTNDIFPYFWINEVDITIRDRFTNFQI